MFVAVYFSIFHILMVYIQNSFHLQSLDVFYGYFFSPWTFYHHCILTNRTYPYLKDCWRLSDAKFTTFIRSLFVSVSVVVLFWLSSATVYYSATLCSEVNYIKLNAAYVLSVRPKPHNTEHTQYQTFFMFSHKNVFNTKQKHMRPPPFVMLYDSKPPLSSPSSSTSSTVLFQLMLNTFLFLLRFIYIYMVELLVLQLLLEFLTYSLFHVCFISTPTGKKKCWNVCYIIYKILVHSIYSIGKYLSKCRQMMHVRCWLLIDEATNIDCLLCP